MSNCCQVSKAHRYLKRFSIVTCYSLRQGVPFHCSLPQFDVLKADDSKSLAQGEQRFEVPTLGFAEPNGLARSFYLEQSRQRNLPRSG